jgi:hypothetical protein
MLTSRARVLTTVAALSSLSRTFSTALTMKYNFGAASSKTPLLFGVEAPGVPMKPGGQYNDPKSVPNAVVEEWADFLVQQDVRRTLCLLNPEELACYEDPGYAELLKSRGITPALVNVFEEGASDKLIEAYEEADKAGEKIAVHCSGGEGRTGVAIGAILVKEAGLSPEEAEKEVMKAAEETGAKRKLAAAKVEKLLEKGTLA